MTEGLPDYARLSLAGGFELYNQSGVLPQNTVLFKGYVGAWPFVNLFAFPSAGAENVTLILQWFSDGTFANNAGFRNIVRSAQNFSGTQYSNLSPWLEMYYRDLSSNPISWDQLSLYGTNQPATPNQVLSSDAPIFSSNAGIAANSDLIITPQHVAFGDATLTVETSLTSWFIRFQYLAANTYTLTFHHRFSNLSMGGGGSVSCPLLDTPYSIDLHNGTAATGTINASLTLK